MSVRVRFAPSPTGIPHIGNTRTALFNWLFARHHGGKFILRIEDTDRKRLVPESLAKILEILRFVGIDWDEGPKVGGPYGPYIQSQRLPIYSRLAHQLVNKGLAYFCFCSPQRLEAMREEQRRKKMPPRYDRYCLSLSQKEVQRRIKKGEKYCIRLKVPAGQKIKWRDLIQGEIVFRSDVIDDQVLLKSDGYPTYHLAVVVDDYLMKITHILRGAEWISSTPKHLLLYQAFGWQPPKIGHFPLILGPDRAKLSKRHGAKSVLDYQAEGYLPEALVNFMALLGWHPKDEQEILSVEELIAEFDLDGIHKSNAIFDAAKLDYLNGVWIRKTQDKRLAKLLRPFLPKMDPKQIAYAVPLVKERIKKLSEAATLLNFVWQKPNYPSSLLLQRGASRAEVIKMLSEATRIIEKVGVEETAVLQKELLDLIKKNEWPTGTFFMVFRVAITGKTITPPLVESLPLLGKQEVLIRLRQAKEKIKNTDF